MQSWRDHFVEELERAKVQMESARLDYENGKPTNIVAGHLKSARRHLQTAQELAERLK